MAVKGTCKLCGKTKNIALFNIEFKPVPICEWCANGITMQHMEDLIKKHADKMRKK